MSVTLEREIIVGVLEGPWTINNFTFLLGIIVSFPFDGVATLQDFHICVGMLNLVTLLGL